MAWTRTARHLDGGKKEPRCWCGKPVTEDGAVTSRWISAGSCLLALAGCALGRGGAALPLPGSFRSQQPRFVVHSDTVVPDQHPLWQELDRHCADVQQALKLPRAERSIQVYLFESPERYHAYLAEHYPDFPLRRACFVRRQDLLAVFACWGQRVNEDLRHEMTHGCLHAAVGELPLWLDEGLAEYFEVAPGEPRVHRAHRELLLSAAARGDWQPDLDRLESIDRVAALQLRDYAEAWAWVHWLLRSNRTRARLLRQYVVSPGEGQSRGNLSERLPETGAQRAAMLRAYLEQLEPQGP